MRKKMSSSSSFWRTTKKGRKDREEKAWREKEKIREEEIGRE